MPGTLSRNFPSTWFEDAFGFPEPQCDPNSVKDKPVEEKQRLYSETRSRFRVSDGVLFSDSGKSFNIGSFEVLSVHTLRDKLQMIKDRAPPAEDRRSLGRLTFHNIVSDMYTLHLDDRNAGAVFQACSLFNCLETTPPSVRPEDGVTCYVRNATQGVACALACPAATVFRNYFATMEGEIDCLAKVAELLDNKSNRYWQMRRGHCLPKSKQSIQKLNQLIRRDQSTASGNQRTLFEKIVQHVQVGIHWDTQVNGFHNVSQVLCSTFPLGLIKKSVLRAHECRTFASALLRSAFEATLSVGACLAAERGQRVKVFLTLVGGGVLGNRREWIIDGIEHALSLYAEEPLDVMLVHMNKLPHDRLESLECGLAASATLTGAAEKQAAAFRQELAALRCNVLKHGAVDTGTLHKAFERVDSNRDGILNRQEITFLDEWRNEKFSKILKTFMNFDVNGDGVVDRSEFEIVLSVADGNFFTDGTIQILLHEADADGDGRVHYFEFVTWLFDEDPIATDRILNVAEML